MPGGGGALFTTRFVLGEKSSGKMLQKFGVCFFVLPTSAAAQGKATPHFDDRNRNITNLAVVVLLLQRSGQNILHNSATFVLLSGSSW